MWFFSNFKSVSYLHYFFLLIDHYIVWLGTDEFLETLLWTGVNGTVWPSRTYLIADVKTDNGVEIFKEFFKNIPNLWHAEEVMLNDDGFLKAVADNSNIEVILTLNYSPCSECAKILKTFYESRKKKITKFIIQFSHLYYMKNEKNKNGLRNLNEAGVTLQAMNPDSWDEVGIDLNVMKAKDRKRITERDKNTADELYRVLFPYKKEQVQDTSVDELSSRFNKQMKF